MAEHVLERFDRLFFTLWKYHLESYFPKSEKVVKKHDFLEAFNDVHIAFNSAHKYVNEIIQKQPDRFDVKQVDEVFSWLQDDMAAFRNKTFPPLFEGEVNPQLGEIQYHFNEYIKLKLFIQALPETPNAGATVGDGKRKEKRVAKTSTLKGALYAYICKLKADGMKPAKIVQHLETSPEARDFREALEAELAIPPKKGKLKGKAKTRTIHSIVKSALAITFASQKRKN